MFNAASALYERLQAINEDLHTHFLDDIEIQDFRYVIKQDKSLASVIIWFSLGDPTIYLDTASNELVGVSGTTIAKLPLSRGLVRRAYNYFCDKYYW